MEDMNVIYDKVTPCSKLKAIEVASFIKYTSDLPAQAPFSHPSQVKLSKWGHFSLKYRKRFLNAWRGVNKNVSQILAIIDFSRGEISGKAIAVTKNFPCNKINIKLCQTSQLKLEQIWHRQRRS